MSSKGFEDFENYEDYEDPEVQEASDSNENTHSEPQLATNSGTKGSTKKKETTPKGKHAQAASNEQPTAPAQPVHQEPAITKEAFEAARQGFVSRQAVPQAPLGTINLDKIGKNVYRLSTSYLTSKKQHYDTVELLVNNHDTVDIKNFEKQLSLPQVIPKVINSFCEQNEQEKIRKQNKDKKKKKNNEPSNLMDEEPFEKFDTKRDLNSDNPHHQFKEALEESNPLNSLEFYDELFASFCNQLDQSTKETKDNEVYQVEERKEQENRDQTGGPMRESSTAMQANPYSSYQMADSFRSPHSTGPYESVYTFGAGYGTYRASVHSRDPGEKPTTAGCVDVRMQTQEKKLISEKEVALARSLVQEIQSLERAGKIKLGSSTALDITQALSSNPLFRYHNIQAGENLLSKDPLNKRVEKEVFLDYERQFELPAVKQLKMKSIGENQYSNQDLVYSSWYDQVALQPNSEEETVQKRSLLVDLNDRSVFYSKLANILTDKDPLVCSMAPVKDHIHQPYHSNDKSKEKKLNKIKKDLRIRIAKGEGLAEVEE